MPERAARGERMSGLTVASDLLEVVRRIGADVAGPAAEAVDREARFPHESIAALREERMLGALVPRELGGRGATIAELGAVARRSDGSARRRR